MKRNGVDLTENDLVFITNGGCVESSSIGSQDQPAAFNPDAPGPAAAGICGSKIAAQDPAFGHPDKFCSDPEQTNWMSATVHDAGSERIIPYIQNICKRDPFSGRVVTGGIVTVKDSGWLHQLDASTVSPSSASSPRTSCVVLGLRPVHRQAR